MKKSLIVLLSVISMGAQAQTNMNDTIFNLSEVTVKGRSIIQKVDRMLIIPTRDARKNAYNPYDLMFNMAIPRLNVNVIGKELTANGGAVQTRINGIKASQAEVEALLPKDIVRIEFIENPGKRYGDGELGAVIDIIVRKREEGGLINVQTTNSPHVLFGENNLTAKYNRGKSQWGLNYALSYRGVKKDHTDKTEDFLLVGGKYVLVEFSLHQQVIGLDQVMFDLQMKNYEIILAHPERYPYYSGTSSKLQHLKDMGINFQVNILSLSGFYGESPKRKAFEMIEKGWVEFMGTDMHNTLYAQALIDATHDRKIIKLMEKHKFLNSHVNDPEPLKTKKI